VRRPGWGLWTSAWGPDEDELYRETCVFRVVDRPRRLVMTCTATAPEGTSLETEVEVTFEEEGVRTRMTVVDYTYELKGDTLTIWFGERGSPAYYEGTLSEDGSTLTGAWHYPGGGYEAISTRIG
jgi:uncharacterized protein YndB with AHSA1/START domain